MMSKRVSDYDKSIHSNRDALAWAKFFIKTKNENNSIIDERLMHSWFASAMMAMHDSICNQEIGLLQSRIKELEAVIERGDEIKNNWENNCYQEAAHYNYIDDKNHEMQQLIYNQESRIKELESAVSEFATTFTGFTGRGGYEKANLIFRKHKDLIESINKG